VKEVWDMLRGDPRFEKIVAALAPKLQRQPCRIARHYAAHPGHAANSDFDAQPGCATRDEATLQHAESPGPKRSSIRRNERDRKK
jgi:hypothetical protein